MREISKPIFKCLPPTKLFLDDVLSIYDMLKEDCEKVIIRVGDYEIDDVSRLRELGSNTTNYVYLEGDTPHIVHVSVTLDRNHAAMYAHDSSALSIGIISKIQELLNKNTRKIARIFYGFPNYLITTFILLCATVAPISLFALGTVRLVLLLTVILFCTIFFSILNGFLLTDIRQSYYLKERSALTFSKGTKTGY